MDNFEVFLLPSANGIRAILFNIVKRNILKIIPEH